MASHANNRPSPPRPPLPPAPSYVAKAYEKLCKKSGAPGGGGHPDVVFLKASFCISVLLTSSFCRRPPPTPPPPHPQHNVLDDEDGRTELAVEQGVRAVPTFMLYRAGAVVATLSTRDKAAVAAAINAASGFDWLA
jgi:hypothetical protein